MTFQAGDRVRWTCTDDDGFPTVRYGFVGGAGGDGTRLVIMLDGEFSAEVVVETDQLESVTITTVELRLSGTDLLDDPTLRQGLVNLWTAEADQAGLEIRSIERLGTGVRDTGSCFALAELWAAGRPWVLRAHPTDDPAGVSVRAEPL